MTLSAPPSAAFYTTGGTLRPDSPSYVERQADKDLYGGLMQGEFCYVLTSRQMGKSSLMNRTARRLREAGVAVAVLDLTAVGQNLTVEQWYLGLLARLGQQLDLEDEVEAYWDAHAAFSPFQRWMGALKEVVLAETDGPLVVFVDELDAVLSLPFGTDEFFAGIRECYNRRSEEETFGRLTFCLLGVASPSDLIQDPRTTPFNIGRRIELTDFTEGEALPLAEGFGVNAATGAALIRRALYWSGGHPYLTQRLCRSLSEQIGKLGNREMGRFGPDGTGNGSAETPISRLPNFPIASMEVDRQCEGLFLTRGAREKDDNLLFVRERLLRHGSVESLLDLYGKVRAGKRVPDEVTNPLVSTLKLSGIVKSERGALKVRNRVYERCFDRAWIAESMPDAELRRQKRAYWRGVLRASLAALVVISVLSVAVFAAVREARRSRDLQQVALSEGEATRRILYAAQMNLADQAWDGGWIGEARRLLTTLIPRSGQADLRGWDWRYLQNLSAKGDADFALPMQSAFVYSLSLNRDGSRLAFITQDGILRLWDLKTRTAAALGELKPKLKATQAAFSPDGRELAACYADGSVAFWDPERRRRGRALGKPASRDPKAGFALGLAYSPGGHFLAVNYGDRAVRVWSTRNWSVRSTLHSDAENPSLFWSRDESTLTAAFNWNHGTRWSVPQGRKIGEYLFYSGNLALSPQGDRMATGSPYDCSVKIAAIPSGRLLADARDQKSKVTVLAFSPDGRKLVSGGDDGVINLYDPLLSWKRVRPLRGHVTQLTQLVFSGDSRTLASADNANRIMIWRSAFLPNPDRLRVADPAIAPHTYLRFSPDGRTLATGSADNRVKLWDVATGRLEKILSGHRRSVVRLAFTPDRRLLMTGTGVFGDFSGIGEGKVWDVKTGRCLLTLTEPKSQFFALGVSPDGRTLATGSGAGRVKLWALPSTSARPYRPRLERTLDAGVPVLNLGFSPNGRYLIAAGETKARLWDLKEGDRARSFAKPQHWTAPLAFTRDSRALAMGGYDGALWLWDVANGRRIVSLRGTPGNTTDSLAFSADGRRLATGRTNGEVFLWDTTSWQVVLRLREHTGYCQSVEFSPDEKTLASSAADGAARLWRTEPRGR